MNDGYKPGLKRDVNKELVNELTDKEKINFTIAGYDSISDDWDKTRQNLWPELEREIMKHIEPGSHILDLGCGNGRLVPLIDDLNDNGYGLLYTGTDPSSGLLDIARSKYIEKNFKSSNGIDLDDFPTNNYDQVISIAVLHHIPPSLLGAWLSEAYRVTRAGSVSIFTTWNLSESKYDLNRNNDAIIGFVHTPNTRYVHYYNYESLQDNFTRAGYKIIEIKDIKRESGMSNTVVVAQK